MYGWNLRFLYFDYLKIFLVANESLQNEIKLVLFLLNSYSSKSHTSGAKKATSLKEHKLKKPQKLQGDKGIASVNHSGM